MKTIIKRWIVQKIATQHNSSQHKNPQHIKVDVLCCVVFRFCVVSSLMSSGLLTPARLTHWFPSYATALVALNLRVSTG